MGRSAADESPAAGPLDAAAFAQLMARFAPFERAPRLAVAVSGGADSMALALLADEWARAAGGAVTALTVDHRLRPQAACEAAQVGAWLARRGIAHVTLVRAGAMAPGAVQAAARAARYRLLEGWCKAEGVLHLVTAHHRDDQAETLLLRLARGSGLDGLAGMAALVEHGACRVLRPVLTIRRARLIATLAARGQDWLEDPSNLDPAYARVRLRRGAALLAEEGLTTERLAATAGHLARARAALEAAVTRLLAESVWLHPAGFAWLDAAGLVAAPPELALRALGAVLACVGGASYPPRLAGIERLHRDLAGVFAAGRTLGGCRVLARRGRVLVCREPEAAAAAVPAPPGDEAAWDNRYLLHLGADAPGGLMLGALGAGPEDAAAAAGRRLLPAAVRPTLPALRDRAGLVAVPHLDYRRQGAALGCATDLALRFCPARPLTHGCFTVV
jgi:tRNA(Ile)-lysidine synthase